MAELEYWPDEMDKADGTTPSNGEATSDAEIPNGITTDVKIVTEESMKCRILKTIALYLGFAGIGFAAPILGLSIVHMEYILNTNTHTMAFTFTCHSIGYTVGGLICALVYDSMNKEFLFAVSLLMSAMTTVAAGFVGNIYAFMAVMFLQGLSMGFIDAGGQSYCINLWKNHRFKEPILQAAHALWSLAATIAPFVIRPFLIELTHSNSLENSVNSTAVDFNETMDNVTSSTTNNDTSTLPEEDFADITKAQYAYLTIGFMIMCTSFLFLVIYFYQCLPIIVPKPPKDASSVKSDRTKSQKQRENCLMMTLLFMLFMFYFLYIYIEGIPLAYFTAFAIKYLDWTVHYATLLMTLFYGMHFAGRVLGIPLSIFLRPRTMVVMNLLLTAAAYILLLFVNIHDGVMWVSAVLAGFGMSSTFAAMLLWVSETVAITGRVASLLLVGGSVGAMTGPLLVGQLFDAASPMWMVYILVISSLLHITLFLILFFYVGKWRANLSENSDEREAVHLNENVAVLAEKSNTEQG